MNDTLERLSSACQVPRPSQFVDGSHCGECAEHDAALRRVTPHTISLSELGNPGWDPACYMLPEAFVYFLPGMARLALGTGEAYYLDQLLFHLGPRRIAQLSGLQRSTLAAFLRSLPGFLLAEAAARLDQPDLFLVTRNLDA